MAQQQHHVVEVTPTVSAASAYQASDQVGGIMTLTGVCPGGAAGAVLRSISIVDKAKQKAALSVLLFDALPAVASVDNGAIDVTDAQMADKCLGHVAIAAADYVDLANNSVATKATEAYVKPSADATIYAVAFTSGTPTYGATSDLVFRFHFSWDQ